MEIQYKSIYKRIEGKLKLQEYRNVKTIYCCKAMEDDDGYINTNMNSYLNGKIHIAVEMSKPSWEGATEEVEIFYCPYCGKPIVTIEKGKVEVLDVLHKITIPEKIEEVTSLRYVEIEEVDEDKQ